MKDPSPIRVMVVDDHWVIRHGLTLIVEREADVAVAATASSGEEALDTFERERPDIVVMDLRLPGMSGFDTIKAMRRVDPRIPIVVLTTYGGDEDVHRALDAGATTYVLKGSPSEDLIRVIRSVVAGERPLSDDVKALLQDRAARPALTPREVGVLQYVMKGHRNKEIASGMAIAEETVEVHLKNIFNKLGVHDRTAAVYVALRRGIIHVE